MIIQCFHTKGFRPDKQSQAGRVRACTHRRDAAASTVRRATGRGPEGPVQTLAGIIGAMTVIGDEHGEGPGVTRIRPSGCSRFQPEERLSGAYRQSGFSAVILWRTTVSVTALPSVLVVIVDPVLVVFLILMRRIHRENHQADGKENKEGETNVVDQFHCIWPNRFDRRWSLEHAHAGDCAPSHRVRAP